MTVAGAHQAVQGGCVEVAEGMAEIVGGYQAMAAVQVIGQPGQTAGQVQTPAPRHGLHDANQDAHKQVNQIIGKRRALFLHALPPPACRLVARTDRLVKIAREVGVSEGFCRK